MYLYKIITLIIPRRLYIFTDLLKGLVHGNRNSAQFHGFMFHGYFIIQ